VLFRVPTGQGKLEKVGIYVVRERSGENIFLEKSGENQESEKLVPPDVRFSG